MKLSTKLNNYFTAPIRARGKQYYRQNRVKLVGVEEDCLKAEVRGTRTYKVGLRYEFDGPDIFMSVSCTCPHFDRGNCCKHLWATLLKVDEIMPDRLSPDCNIILEDEFGDDGEDTEWGEEGAWPEPHKQPAQKGQSRRETSWKSALKDIDKAGGAYRTAPSGQMAESPDERVQVRYVIPLDEIFRDSEFRIQAMCRERRKSGEWGAWTPVNTQSRMLKTAGEDYLLVSALRSAQSEDHSRGYYYYSKPLGSDGQGFMRLLPGLCRTGRLYAVYGEKVHGPLTWDEGGAWGLALELAREGKAHHYTLAGQLVRDGQHRPLCEPLLLHGVGLIVWHDAVSLLNTAEHFNWIIGLRKKEFPPVPVDEAEQFVESLLNSATVPELVLPEDLRFEQVCVEPSPKLTIVRSDDGNRAALPGRMTFDYDGCDIDMLEPRVMLYDKGGRRIIRRDREIEQGFWVRLIELGGRAIDYPQYGKMHNCHVHRKRFPEMVRALLAEGWQVLAENGKPYRLAGAFRVSVSSGIDWFDLEVSCDFEGEAMPLPSLLSSAQKKQNWVRLGDGSYGVLPEEWLEQHAGMISMGKPEGEAIRFRPSQTYLLDAWLSAQPNVTADQKFKRIRKQLRGFDAIRPEKEPKGFKGSLRGYQQEGLGWFAFLQNFGFGGCLADDMGLGKTIQILALLEKRRAQSAQTKNEDGRKPCLVVAPRSVIFNWKREAGHFTPRLRVLEHVGADRRKDVDEFADVDLVLTTYGTLRRDIGFLKDYVFSYVVLDEAQAIKNSHAQTAKAARLLQAEHRLALSGTPIENHLGELWSLFEFLNPGFLGSQRSFDTHWVKCAESQQRELLGKMLRPFILRRTKGQVASELPDRQDETQYCDLPAKQRKLYDELRDHYKKSLLAKVDKAGLNRSKMNILEALLRLRQAACHPGLINDRHVDIRNAKFDALLPQLDEVMEEGHKALVFSQFTSLLALLRSKLDAKNIAYAYLDGRTRKRQQCVDRFQTDDDCGLFLVSLKAGGLGLNLTAAEYVFLLDPWWNPAVEAQAIDRAHRIGQTRTVFTYRLIARDTIEERVLELQESKRELAASILTEDNSLLKNLTREDLAYLLG